MMLPCRSSGLWHRARSPVLASFPALYAIVGEPTVPRVAWASSTRRSCPLVSSTHLLRAPGGGFGPGRLIGKPGLASSKRCENSPGSLYAFTIIMVIVI